MAITSVEINPTDAPPTSQKTSDATTYTHTYRVVSDVADVNPVDIYSAADPSNGISIPDIGDAYTVSPTSDLSAVVESIRERCVSDDGCVYDVAVTWSTAAETVDNPLLRAPEITWGSERFTEPLEIDLSQRGSLFDGVPVVTTAGEPLNPKPEVERNRPVLTVVINQSTFSVTTQTFYENAVNTDLFHGFTPGQVKVDSIRATKERENAVDFWRVTYVFKFKREGWRIRPLNAGFYVNVNNEFVAIRDAQDQPVSKPVAITQAGSAKVDPDDASKAPSDGGPYYLDFYGYKEISLAPLAALFTLT